MSVVGKYNRQLHTAKRREAQRTGRRRQGDGTGRDRTRPATGLTFCARSDVSRDEFLSTYEALIGDGTAGRAISRFDRDPGRDMEPVPSEKLATRLHGFRNLNPHTRGCDSFPGGNHDFDLVA